MGCSTPFTIGASRYVKPVAWSPDGARHLPGNNLGEGVFGKNIALDGQRLGLHGGE